MSVTAGSQYAIRACLQARAAQLGAIASGYMYRADKIIKIISPRSTGPVVHWSVTQPKSVLREPIMRLEADLGAEMKAPHEAAGDADVVPVWAGQAANKIGDGFEHIVDRFVVTAKLLPPNPRAPCALLDTLFALLKEVYCWDSASFEGSP